MLKINIIKNKTNRIFDIQNKHIKDNMKKICNELAIDNVEINLSLCDNSFIEKLNLNYKKKKGPTDVLSFLMNEINPETGLKILGDIIISLEQIIENSDNYKQEYVVEFYRVLIHGILHLSGIHHNSDKEYDTMNSKTVELLKLISI